MGRTTPVKGWLNSGIGYCFQLEPVEGLPVGEAEEEQPLRISPGVVTTLR